ncbi:hypothetical protein [Thermalbibacter longus]|nr:hypothetical protein [Thermalbibacter longus]
MMKRKRWLPFVVVLLLVPLGAIFTGRCGTAGERRILARVGQD